MSEFTYKGPSSTLFLSKDKSGSKTLALVTGQTYSDLDETHPQVKNLIAHKLLVKEAGAKSQPKDSAAKTEQAQTGQTKGKGTDQQAQAATGKEGSEQ